MGVSEESMGSLVVQNDFRRVRRVASPRIREDPVAAIARQKLNRVSGTSQNILRPSRIVRKHRIGQCERHGMVRASDLVESLARCHERRAFCITSPLDIIRSMLA